MFKCFYFSWKQAALDRMEIQSPGANRNFVRQLRQGSLYDETPLIGMYSIIFAVLCCDLNF